MVERHGKRGLGVAYWLAVSVLQPSLSVFTRRDRRGDEYLRRRYPGPDGIVVATNHLSWFDPMNVCHTLWDNGRPPRFMAKEALFHTPIVGWIMDNCGHIPVLRDTESAAEAVQAAESAIADGEAVVVYVEGTVTRDPNLWPMTGKTGAAQIALSTGCPVIPMAQWGPQEVTRPYTKELNLLPRKTMQSNIGPPVDLDDLRGLPITAEVLDQATERIVDAITGLLAELRNETPPETRLDFRQWRRDHGSKGSPSIADLSEEEE